MGSSKNLSPNAMVPLRKSSRLADNREKQQNPPLVAVTKNYRCTRVGTKNVYKMTDKTTHRRGGTSKNTLLIKATPIEDLIGPGPWSQEENVAPEQLPRNVVGVTDTYLTSTTSTDNIYSTTERVTHYRDGTTKKTLVIKTTPIEDTIGPDPGTQ